MVDKMAREAVGEKLKKLEHAAFNCSRVFEDRLKSCRAFEGVDKASEVILSYSTSGYLLRSAYEAYWARNVGAFRVYLNNAWTMFSDAVAQEAAVVATIEEYY